MKLILVRHGETIENQKNIAQGQNPGTLSKEGLIQAKEIGKELSKEKIDLIYSSSLRRAKQTAKEIQKFFPDKKIKFTRKIIERNFGSFQGKPYPKRWNILVWKPGFLDSNKGEGVDEIFLRIGKFLDELRMKYPEKTILLITHKRVIQTILAISKGTKIENLGRMKIPENGKAIKIEIK